MPYEATAVHRIYDLIEEIVTPDVKLVRTNRRTWKPSMKMFGVVNEQALHQPGKYYVVPGPIAGLEAYPFGGLTDVQLVGVSVLRRIPAFLLVVKF